MICYLHRRDDDIYLAEINRLRTLLLRYHAIKRLPIERRIVELEKWERVTKEQGLKLAI